MAVPFGRRARRWPYRGFWAGHDRTDPGRLGEGRVGTVHDHGRGWPEARDANPSGSDEGTIRIVDLLNGKVLATAASEPWVLEGQFFPETAEVLFYQFPAAPDRDRLTTWRYLEGEPTDCVEVDPGSNLLLVDRRTALVFRGGERPIGRLDVEACAIEWGAPMIQAGQMLDRHGRPTNILWPQLLLPDRARFAYFDVTHNLDPKVVIRSVDDIDHELARIEGEPTTQIAREIFVTANDLGVSGTAWHDRFLPGVTTRELRLFRLSDYKLARRLNIEQLGFFRRPSTPSQPTGYRRRRTSAAGCRGRGDHRRSAKCPDHPV